MMRCSNPIKIETPKGEKLTARCRQCVPCRIRRQKEWAFRCQLEAPWYAFSSFITLTFRPELQPGTVEEGYPLVASFWKRLRKSSGHRIRYFCCGEYGEKSKLAHYHAIVFGLGPLPKGHWSTPLWPHGYAWAGEVNQATINYTTRYCLKGASDDEKGNKMWASLKPPLGVKGAFEVGYYLGSLGADWNPDISSLSMGGRNYPLSPVIRNAYAEGYVAATGKRAPLGSGLRAHVECILELKAIELGIVNKSSMQEEKYARMLRTQKLMKGLF